jgi:putative nucleotidyltransferase with HDIG domain
MRITLSIADEARKQEAVHNDTSAVPCPLRGDTAVHRLFRALGAYDPATAAHSVRVRWYALWIAEELGLDPLQTRQLSAAALLHDLGKLCVSRSILHKPGPLSASEYRVMQRHSVVGERLVRATIPCPAVAAAIRSHHERPDGGGYPDGLEHGEIPLLAQILAVADAYDAMTSKRVYAATLRGERAVAVLRGEEGRQFEALIVQHFVTSLSKPWARGTAR